MANHNVLITNPQGERRHEFVDNRTRAECQSWMTVFGPAPIGWKYQIINLHKNERKYPNHIEITGYKLNEEGEEEVVDVRKARFQHNNGHWYTPKQAKKDARGQGAQWFKRKKVFA